MWPKSLGWSSSVLTILVGLDDSQGFFIFLFLFLLFYFSPKSLSRDWNLCPISHCPPSPKCSNPSLILGHTPNSSGRAACTSDFPRFCCAPACIGVTVNHKGAKENVAGIVDSRDRKAKGGGEATESREQDTETFWGCLVSVVQNLFQQLLGLGWGEFNSQTCTSETDLATGSLSSCSQGW